MGNMDQAKVLEYLNQSVMADYLQRLLSAKISKLTLFPSLPIIGTPNISEPVQLAMIDNATCLIGRGKNDLN